MALATSVTHSTAADGTFSATGATAWNAGHTVGVTGVVSGGIRYGTSTTAEDYSALLAANAVVLGGGAGAAPFTDAGFTYNPATDLLTVNKGITAGGSIIVGNAGVGDYVLKVLNDNTSTAAFQWYAVGGSYIQENASSATIRWNQAITLSRLSDTFLQIGGASAGFSGGLKLTNLTIDTGSLQLGNAFVATPQVSTGYIIIKDSTGTSYKVSCNP